MRQLNILEAKTHLSSLVSSLEAGAEEEILIARHGKPVARLTALAQRKANRFGAAAQLLNALSVPQTLEAFNAGDADIAADFEGSLEADLALAQISPAR